MKQKLPSDDPFEWLNRARSSFGLAKAERNDIIIINNSEPEETMNEQENILLKISDFAVSTGIPDLAVNHDHYLYGTKKQVNNE